MIFNLSYFECWETPESSLCGPQEGLDRVPRDVVWWAMRKEGVDQWVIRLLQSLHKGAKRIDRVWDTYSKIFSVNVGIHQGSVLSPLLLILVL